MRWQDVTTCRTARLDGLTARVSEAQVAAMAAPSGAKPALPDATEIVVIDRRTLVESLHGLPLTR